MLLVGLSPVSHEWAWPTETVSGNGCMCTILFCDMRAMHTPSFAAHIAPISVAEIPRVCQRGSLIILS